MPQNDRYNEIRILEMIHRHGVRPSAQRIAVLSYVANTDSHPTADEIYAGVSRLFPSMSRTTVYNSLHVLVDAGLVKELDIESGNRHYDLAPQPQHGHFICRLCGRIIDMAYPPALADSTADGSLIESIDVCFKGVCPECNKIMVTD